MIIAITDRRLMVPAELTDWRDVCAAFAAAIRRATFDELQVREKDLDGGPLLALVRAAIGTGARVIVNDRLDVALAAGAHGVHLPERGMAVADVRRVAPGLRVGVSRHDPLASADGADYVQLGPIFATPGKGPALGVEALSRARFGVPVNAVGGIDRANASACMAAGAAGVAMIRSAWA